MVDWFMHKNKAVTLSVSDRVTCICGSIDFKDYTPLDYEILRERMFNCVEDWSAVKEYYFIFHDETQTYHMHYILIFKGQQYVSAIVNRFCDHMQVEPVAVNYERLIARNAHLRYLLHIDAKSVKEGKKQYDYLQINSNVHSGLIRCFIDSKDDKNRIDMRTLEGICVSCKGSELRIAEFLDGDYDRYYRKIRLILDNYSEVRDNFDEGELPF